MVSESMGCNKGFHSTLGRASDRGLTPLVERARTMRAARGRRLGATPTRNPAAASVPPARSLAHRPSITRGGRPAWARPCTSAPSLAPGSAGAPITTRRATGTPGAWGSPPVRGRIPLDGHYFWSIQFTRRIRRACASRNYGDLQRQDEPADNLSRTCLTVDPSQPRFSQLTIQHEMKKRKRPVRALGRAPRRDLLE